MANLKVRWRGEVYEIATCLNEERAALAERQWPDGVVDIALVMSPDRPRAEGASPPDTFKEHERRSLVKMVLRSLGESATSHQPKPPAELRKTETKAVPAGFGTMGKATVSRPLERRKIDHAFVTELAEQRPPVGFGVKREAAIKRLGGDVPRIEGGALKSARAALASPTSALEDARAGERERNAARVAELERLRIGADQAEQRATEAEQRTQAAEQRAAEAEQRAQDAERRAADAAAGKAGGAQ